MAPIKEWFGLYNVIYKWIYEKYGMKDLEEYWRFIADMCFDDVIEKFQNEGLEGVKNYFEHIFKLDNGEITSLADKNSLTLEILKCPDYEFMNNSENASFKPIDNYCRHHLIINSIIAQKSGLKFTMPECDNRGKCKWVFKV